MKIEIHMDELGIKFSQHPIVIAAIEHGIREEVQNVFKKHRAALIADLETTISQCMIHLVKEARDQITKIVITTPDA